MNLRRVDTKLPFDEMIISNLKAARPFSLFAFLITQAAAAAPTVVNLFTDLAAMLADTPIVPAYARTGAGVYTITITGAFPNAAKFPKTDGILDAATGTRYSLTRTSNDVLTLRTFAADGTATDGLLTSKLIEVKVWD
jgi:hypothetical protein